MDPASYEQLRNRTLLFFIEKLVEKSPRSLHDLSCQFGSRNFTKEMRQIAGGSQSGLKKFLAMYPSLFKVDGETIAYAETAQSSEDPVLSRDYNREAVDYFRSRLMAYGFNVHVPIRSLLGHRSQAPPEIRHVSGQHITPFTNFLRQNSEFIVSEDHVWLKEFDGAVVGQFVEINMDFDRGAVFRVCSFFVELIERRGPMLVEQLFHAIGGQEDLEWVDLFKGVGDLAVFLRIQPQCFQVHSNLVTLAESSALGLQFLQQQQQETGHSSPSPAHSGQKSMIFAAPPSSPSRPPHQNQSNSSPPPPEPPPTIPALLQLKIPPPCHLNPTHVVTCTNQKSLKSRVSALLLDTINKNNSREKFSSSDSLRAEPLAAATTDLLSRTVLVTSARKGREVAAQLRLRRKEISLDCEGVNLGIDGRVTLVQVGDGDNVYVFDLLAEGMGEELRTLLEDGAVVKVMHDCRNDSVNLYNQFGIQLINVFDTQSAHSVIQTRSADKVKNISLNNMCSAYGLPVNPFKEKVKGIYRHDQKYWLRRPLTKQMLAYASADVVSLLQMHGILRPLIQDWALFTQLCEEQVFAHITPDDIKARRRLRKNNIDMAELRKKIDGSRDRRALVLSNREVRLLKHMNLPQSTLAQLSTTSAKVARKLSQSAAKLNSDSSAESNLNSLDDSSTTTTAADKIHTIEKLIDTIIATDLADNRVDVATQTVSTGDIVLSSVWTE